MVHLVEILRDKKLLQTNKDKSPKSNIHHAPVAFWSSPNIDYKPEIPASPEGAQA